MEQETLRRVHGGIRLAADGVEAVVGAVAELQRTVMGQVYGPFAVLGPLAAPAQLVEQIQTALSKQVYGTILGANRAIASIALALIDAQAEQGGITAAAPASADGPAPVQPPPRASAHRPQVGT